MSEGPETKLVRKMREAGQKKYGDRLVQIKYHGSAMSQAGVSDLLDCLDGTFVAVEVKAPESYGGSIDRAVKDGPSVKQLSFLRKVIAAGGIGAVCASVEGYLAVLERAES